MSFEKLLLLTLFFWSFSWTWFFFIMPGKILKLKAFTRHAYLRFQILLALDEHFNRHALKYEHISFQIYLTTELQNIYLHKYKEKERVNLSNMLVFIFTLSLENWKGIKRVPGVGQGFAEYFRLSARGSKPFWLVYINSYYSLIIIMQFICNLICNIVQFCTG